MNLKLFISFLSLGLLSLGGLSVGACTKQNAAAQSAISTIDGNEAKRLIAENNSIVIDVRTPEEFASGHVENATNIDFLAANFEEKIAQLPKDKTYVLYCRSGNRSGKAMGVFQKQGFTNVKNVAGGYSQLK